jgi:membrane protease YdiL (CAAX protease family)
MRIVRPLLAILFVAALGLGLPILGAMIAQTLHVHLPAVFPAVDGPLLPWLYSQHLFQTLLALVAIVLIRLVIPFDAGLRLPPGKSYIRASILWGIFFGVLMTLVDFYPQLLAHRAPDLGVKLSDHAAVAGWLVFEGIYVGPTEEILFRSLLVGFLLAVWPARLKLGRYEIGWAGIVVAAIFAFAHLANFLAHPDWSTFGQQLYAFALGVLYAYWFEKSRSVAAPIVGHNVGDVVEYALCFTLMALWS